MVHPAPGHQLDVPQPKMVVDAVAQRLQVARNFRDQVARDGATRPEEDENGGDQSYLDCDQF